MSSAPLFPFLEQLLQGETVVWKSIEEISKTITAPAKLKGKEYELTGEVPIIDQGINYIAGYTHCGIPSVPKGEYIIFGDHSEHIKYVDFAFVQGADGLKILVVKEAMPKFVYYAFLNFYERENSYKRHWSEAKTTLIPLPSVRVQRRIVEILDKFTNLEAELKAELKAEQSLRNKQYTFYRNELLDFHNPPPMRLMYVG